MLKIFSGFFDKLLRRYTPDPFVLALLLTFLLFILGIAFTDTSPEKMILYWGDGFWSLTTFTLQMVMILVGGYVVAASPFIHKFLTRIAKSFSSPSQAIVVTTFVALLGSWLNWGFGLVIGALLCRKVAHVMPKINFRLLVASAYSGFLIWHGGLSASIPLLLATPGNFSEKMIGGIIPVEATIFSSFNIITMLAVSGAILLLNYYLGRTHGHDEYYIEDDTEVDLTPHPPSVPAEKIENSVLLTLLCFLFALSYIILQLHNGTFRMDLNGINFIFLFIGFLMHGNANKFIGAVLDATKRVGPILLQFPFYAAIMGMMTSSGLADLISHWFIKIASAHNFNLFTLYSAGIVNLFVPSGGGQWAVQGPIIIPAAQALGLDTAKAAMAVAWGDAWTNMLQPFWALPILAIAGLKLRDIMGYCVLFLVVSGCVLSVCFLLL